ncbi:MAG: methyltransferase domain-containing protein [Pseudomonadota bacterium]
MSFSSDWLALRAPADAAARHPALVDRLAAWAAAREPDAPLRIVDLGAGSGATHRALAHRLPDAEWTLVDADDALLAEAARTTGARTLRLDLTQDIETAVTSADLVTASALFDLVSADWLARFAAALPPRAAVYAALTYDGRETWSPAHAAEGAALTAFHAHMRRDKGFGPALGPDAPAALAAALADRALTTAPSPWRLAEADRALIEQLADGATDAVRDTGALDPQTLEDWRETRRQAKAVAIGHADLLALPRGA